MATVAAVAPAARRISRERVFYLVIADQLKGPTT
jgi:hypothetical protein